MIASPKILGIDTSTDACSVALLINGSITEQYEVAPKAHARLLLSMIDAVLKRAECTLVDLDALAFGRGPGSFTGVRIASSVVQALSFGINKPIIPVSALRAIAQSVFQEREITQSFAYLDARMQEIYWGLFELGKHNIMQAVSPEAVQVMNTIVLPPGNWESITGYPRAKEIVRIAAFEFSLGHIVTAEDALPVYVRDAVAKKREI